MGAHSHHAGIAHAGHGAPTLGDEHRAAHGGHDKHAGHSVALFREWSALTDSVKQAELPSLKGQALSARMRAHADRVRRLIAAHEQIMKSMH